MQYVFILLVLGCLSLDNPDYPPAVPLDPELTSCAADEECAVVQLGCCDHCNGGIAVATNLQSEEEVRDAFSETCGTTYACTLVGCPPLLPVCNPTDGCTLDQGKL